MTAVPYVHAADVSNADTPSMNPTVSPVIQTPERGHVSSSEDRLDRAAQLKAKIKAIEEQEHHPVSEEKAVPLYNQTAHGSEQLKEKMNLSKDAGKRGNKRLTSYVEVIFGQGILDDSHPEAKMSFKERLKQEQEKQRAKKEKHE